MIRFVPTIGKSWAKHNQLLEKHNRRFEKDNEQFEKRNRLLGHEQPSLRRKTVSHGPFATVQIRISNRLSEKLNRAKRKKAGV
jgi:hypothetical protein